MEQSLYSIARDYSFLDSTKAVAIVPIKDFNISEKYVIGGNINILWILLLFKVLYMTFLFKK